MTGGTRATECIRVLLSSVISNKHWQRRERREENRGIKAKRTEARGERGVVDENSWRDAERERWTDIVTGGRIDKQDRDGGTPPS